MKKRPEKPSRQVIAEEAGSVLASGVMNTPVKQRANIYWVCLLLIGLNLAIYWQTARFDFVSFDDNTYVKENPHVQAGFTRESLVWAFTTMHASNWHPLTWLSHMLDCRLYGLKPAGHHLSSVFLHVANSLLLLLVLRRMTGDLWRSALVAALFAVHPLHVESVAWIAERKEVLSTFWGLIALWCYVRYIEAPGLRRYLAILLAYALSLMAKPMWVTFPFLLLLLDYWPLRRSGGAPIKAGGVKARISEAIREKAALFGLSAASCVATYLAQQKGGAMGASEMFPLAMRIQNALVAYAGYLGKTLWPRGLAFYYPHRGLRLPMWQALLALILLISVTYFALRMARRLPYLAVGWLWYVGTLVPVIGLIQVGQQAMADRYTYVPLIGIFVMVAWGVPSLLAWRFTSARRRRPSSSISDTHGWAGLAAVAILAILSLASCAWIQAGYWRDTVALCERALSVTQRNWMAHNNLGIALKAQGRLEEAAVQFKRALEIAPNLWQAHLNLGRVLYSQGKFAEAIIHLGEGLRKSPAYSQLGHSQDEYELGYLLSGQGRIEEAIAHLSEAVRIDPGYAKAQNDLGIALARVGRLDEAVAHFFSALRATPDDELAHNNLAIVLADKGEVDQAISHYSEALRIRPNFASAHNNLGFALARIGRTDEAIVHFREALRLKPDHATAHANLASALLASGDLAGAWQEVKLCRNLGIVLAPSLLKELARKMPEPAGRAGNN